MDSDAVSLLGVDSTAHVYGGRLCLAIVNSIWYCRGPAPEEHLGTYAELIDLVDGAGWLPDRDALARAAADRPGDARRALAHAVDLREHMLAAFAAHAAGSAAPAAAVASIEKLGTRGLAELHLDPNGAGYRLSWRGASLELPVHQVAASALLLLASPELDRVKQCPGSTCGWVFVDTTRNRSRRWCNSAECGNRSRVQAHYQRTRATSS
jgi:predicted RNA-binding Zn ribbon-like protein